MTTKRTMVLVALLSLGGCAVEVGGDLGAPATCVVPAGVHSVAYGAPVNESARWSVPIAFQVPCGGDQDAIHVSRPNQPTPVDNWDLAGNFDWVANGGRGLSTWTVCDRDCGQFTTPRAYAFAPLSNLPRGSRFVTVDVTVTF